MAQTDRDFENQANLISKAKAEWVKKTMPKEAKEGGGKFKFFLGNCRSRIPLVLRVLSHRWEDVTHCWLYLGIE